MQKWRYRLVRSVQPCIPFTVLNIVQPLGKWSSCLWKGAPEYNRHIIADISLFLAEFSACLPTSQCQSCRKAILPNVMPPRSPSAWGDLEINFYTTPRHFINPNSSGFPMSIKFSNIKRRNCINPNQNDIRIKDIVLIPSNHSRRYWSCRR